MGIRFNAVHLLASTLALSDDLSDKTLLTVGVQDCYFTFDQVLSFLRDNNIRHQPLKLDEVVLTTGFRGASVTDATRYRKCIHQRTLFRLLGFADSNIMSLDASDYEGADIVHDLNTPVSDALGCKFDFIFDGGTLEHVFSIKDALFNFSRMCKVGGVVVNFNPVDYVNHGFVNVNADLFRDFFGHNGFTEVALKYVAMPRHAKTVDRYYLEYSPDEYQWSLQPFYYTAIYSAYRKGTAKDPTVPTQGFYRKLHAGGAPSPARTTTNTFRATVHDMVRNFIDCSLVSSALVRDALQIRRGKKVLLRK